MILDAKALPNQSIIKILYLTALYYFVVKYKKTAATLPQINGCPGPANRLGRLSSCILLRAASPLQGREYRKMLQRIKTELHLKINELFAEAAVDELAGDFDEYNKKMLKISYVADTLGVTTEINYVRLNLKDETEKASCLSVAD